MPEITDEYMQAQLAAGREYALVLLRKGENYGIFTYEAQTRRSFPGDALPRA